MLDRAAEIAERHKHDPRNRSQKYANGGTFIHMHHMDIVNQAYQDTKALEDMLTQFCAGIDGTQWMVIMSFFLNDENDKDVRVATIGGGAALPLVVEDLNVQLKRITDRPDYYRYPRIRIINLEYLSDEIDEERNRRYPYASDD